MPPREDTKQQQQNATNFVPAGSGGPPGPQHLPSPLASQNLAASIAAVLAIRGIILLSRGIILLSFKNIQKPCEPQAGLPTGSKSGHRSMRNVLGVSIGDQLRGAVRAEAPAASGHHTQKLIKHSGGMLVVHDSKKSADCKKQGGCTSDLRRRGPIRVHASGRPCSRQSAIGMLARECCGIYGHTPAGASPLGGRLRGWLGGRRRRCGMLPP